MKASLFNTADMQDGQNASSKTAPLVLALASVGLTAAFVFGIEDASRSAINWLMPVGSFVGLLGSAMSLRGSAWQSQTWIAAGTLSLVAAAIVTSGVLSAETGLLAAGFFSAGLAFASGKPAKAIQSQTTESVTTGSNVLEAALFFDEVAQIDVQSKIIATRNVTLSVGTTVVERIHVTDRPAFLMACSKAGMKQQSLTVRMRVSGESHFSDTQIILGSNAGALFVALRPATAISLAMAEHELWCDVAHELRTPLAAIIGFADALADGRNCTDAMRRDYPRLIAATGRNLIEMTGAILQPESAEIEKLDVPLSIVAQHCLSVLEPMAKQKSIVLYNRIPAHLGGKAVDGNAMRQILTNLVSNAIKFSPAGASVELSSAVAANGWTLQVTDNGHGLSPEDVARLGQRNFRSKNASGIAGYGLGISIVQKLVDKIGGRMSFESRPGKGTQVTVAFPAASLVDLSNFQQQAQKERAFQSNLPNEAGEKHAAA